MGNFYLYKIGEFLTKYLPLPASYALATFFSDCQYLLSKTDRQAVEYNLKIVLNTDRVPAAMVRHVFRYFGQYLADFFVMPKKLNKEFIKKYVEISGSEHLNEVLHQGKGGIILGAHVGNWEMGAAVLSLLGFPLTIVALAHKDARVNAFFNSHREFFGTTVIQTNLALRRCLEHLKRNRLIAILADRDFGHHGLAMNFLGRKAMIPKGAAFFSLKTGAPLIPAFFLRGSHNSFNFILGEPIYPPSVQPEGINDHEIKQFTNKYLYLIEDQIRQNPSQWLMFRRFDDNT